MESVSSIKGCRARRQKGRKILDVFWWRYCIRKLVLSYSSFSFRDRVLNSHEIPFGRMLSKMFVETILKVLIVCLFSTRSPVIDARKLGKNIFILQSPQNSPSIRTPSSHQPSTSSSNDLIIIDANSNQKKSDKKTVIFLGAASNSVSSPIVSNSHHHRMTGFEKPDFLSPLPIPAPFLDTYDMPDFNDPSSLPLMSSFTNTQPDYQPRDDHRDFAESEEDEEIISLEEDNEDEKIEQSYPDNKKGTNDSNFNTNSGNNHDENSYNANSNDNSNNGSRSVHVQGGNTNNLANINQLPASSTPKPTDSPNADQGKFKGYPGQGDGINSNGMSNNGGQNDNSRRNMNDSNSSFMMTGGGSTDTNKPEEGDKNRSPMMKNMMNQMSSLADSGVKKTTSCAISEMNHMMMIQMMQLLLKMKFKDDSVNEANEMKTLWTSILSQQPNCPPCKFCPSCSVMSGGSPNYGEDVINVPNIVYEIEKYPVPRIEVKRPASITEVDTVSLPISPGKLLPPNPVMMASTERDEDFSLISLPNRKNSKRMPDLEEYKETKKATARKNSLDSRRDHSPLVMKSRDSLPRDRSFNSPSKEIYSDSNKIEVIETAELSKREYLN